MNGKGYFKFKILLNIIYYAYIILNNERKKKNKNTN